MKTGARTGWSAVGTDDAVYLADEERLLQLA
jgi:hypothetical protein